MSKLQVVINQEIQCGEESICKSCVHRFVCRAYGNQSCVECNHFLSVVRCKDCEYWDATQEAPLSEGCFLCTLEGGYPKGDFYCALGERRMDGDEE